MAWIAQLVRTVVRRRKVRSQVLVQLIQQIQSADSFASYDAQRSKVELIQFSNGDYQTIKMITISLHSSIIGYYLSLCYVGQSVNQLPFSFNF